MYALEPLSMQYVIDAINAPKRNLSLMFYEQEYYEKRAQERFEAHYYEQCVQNVRLYEGVGALLESLKSSDVKLAVATNAPSVFAKRMLSHLNVADFFQPIVGADMVAFPKPHEEMLQMILRHYDFKAHSDTAWMIGDNSKDMLSAANANIHSIFVTWGFSKEGAGDHYVENPEHVAKIISQD
jgi:phosphoglycolate phosphatase